MAEISLHPIREADQAIAVAMLRNDKVAKTYMLPDFASEEEVVKLFRRLMAMSAGEETYVRGGYDGETLVGWINQVGAEEGMIEVGYAVAPDKWNRGYGTAMLKAAAEELFQRGWRIIRAGYFEGNDASRRVMEKCGMRPVDWTDTVMYRGERRRCFYMEKHNK